MTMTIAHSDRLQELLDSFRSLLDEALVIAIANERDLSSDSEFAQVKKDLTDLALDVTAEEASGFNAAGLGDQCLEPGGEGYNHSATSVSCGTHSEVKSQTTESSSNEFSSSSFAQQPYVTPPLTSFDHETEEGKIEQLKLIFPDLKEHDIRFALKKAKGGFQEALDDLLNIQYLKSTGQEARGIDGFFQHDESTPVKRGKKRRGTARQGSSTTDSNDNAMQPNESKIIKHADDIGFLADAFGLPFDNVSEIYQKKHCSSGATVVEILDINIASGLEAHGDEGKQRAKELAQKHSNVPEKYMRTLVHVVISDGQFSDELAALLSKHFTKNPWTQKLKLDYRLHPLPSEELELLSTQSASASLRTTPVTTPRPLSMTGLADYTGVLSLTDQHYQAARDAQSSAQRMIRGGGAHKGLYAQGASVYSERAREHGHQARAAGSVAADLLVNQSASPSQIDLHGVTVADGVRIAKQRVQSWWDGLGEFRAKKAKERPFTVVTGLGRHSAGGVSQLRKAVAAALLQDGWKMEVETGRYVITGRRAL